MWNIQDLLYKIFNIQRKADIEDGKVDGEFLQGDMSSVGLREIIIHKLFS